VLAPVLALVASVLVPETDIWSHLWATRLPGMLLATAVLVAVVTAAAAVLGTSLAWLVAAHRFRGRGLLVWLLALPLAIPAYVSGFVVLDTFDRSGPVRSWWGDVAGAATWYPEVRSLPFAALVLTLALYPYVYLLTLGAFRDQAAGLVDAARTLGCSRREAFVRVALPAARPAVIAGSVLVALEVLTDVGTVRLFNVQTLTDGVFRVWFDLGQREGATELASLLLLAAVAILLAERRATSRRGESGGPAGTGHSSRLVPASPGRGARIGIVAAWFVVGAALAFPVSRLVLWTAEAIERGRTASVAGGVGHHLGSTLAVTGTTLVVCVVLGVVVALGARWVPGRRQAALTSATTLGYGLPGPVIALGVLVCLAAIDRTGLLPRGVLLVGSFAGLVGALVVRYLSLAVKPAQDSIGRVGRSVEDAARGLGASRARVVGRIQLPLARSGLLVAAALVALDVTKELPATLLLRPFGIDTLPVWVWQASSDSRWVEAGLPSLILVVVAAVPTMVLVSLMTRGRSIDL
jgi:iron(III) transport system permease protein